MQMDSCFFVTAGSIEGREHARLHRNNQDGVALNVAPHRLVAVVTDGCSAGRYSEIGARLGATWLAGWLPRYLDAPCSNPDAPTSDLAFDLAAALDEHLLQLAATISPAPIRLKSVIADYLLFTFLVAIIEPERTRVLGLGDGVVLTDTERTIIDPGPDNAPSYAAYRLLHGPAGREPVVYLDSPTDQVGALMIGTDGASELPRETCDELLTGPVPGNPMVLQRKLTVLREQDNALFDDTTVALFRQEMRR